MLPSLALPSLATTTVFSLVATAAAQNIDPDLVGTWTTKSRKVVTGPGFYDPVGERMFEPDLTGFSYSFTDDGHFEEAYYRAISNPVDPSCPKGIIQWQHGTYTKNANGSLTLTPIGVDGRQLMSDPCNYQNAIYTRYNQREQFKSYQVLLDTYSKAQRLNLFAFDGSPLNAMYLAYRPPQMLPTVTLNPTASATGAAQSKGTAGGKLKKRFHGGDEGLVVSAEEEKEHLDMVGKGQKVLVRKKERMMSRDHLDADKLWWIGVGITALGGIGYFCF